MSSEMDNFTQKLLERTRARNEALQQKMQEHSFQSRKRRPLEPQENRDNIVDVACSNAGETYGDEENVLNESLNKKSRMANDIPDKPSDDMMASAPKHTGEKSVSERMQRLLKQRQQWEAADQGQDVDFGNLSSPVQHHRQSPAKANFSARKVDIDRKARLAAFAQEVKSREDDLNHPDIPRASPEKVPVQRKQPSGTGSKSSANDGDLASSEPSSATLETDEPCKSKDTVRPVKNISQRVSLSIETLTQFSNKNYKPSERASNVTPIKMNVSTKLAAERIAAGSCKKGSDESTAHQITPTTKSLQERLIELQKHGCNADKTTAVTKSITEQQQELEQELLKCESPEKEESSETEDGYVTYDTSAALNESITEGEYEESMKYDESATLEKSEITSELNESGTSFGDSMMASLDHNQDVETSIAETQLGSSANVDQQMIDDLFEGVELVQDDSFLGPPLFSDMENFGKHTLTRQKSRQEIRSELTVCKQNYHEAEDRLVIRRNPSRRLRPLARSNSTDSITSLDHDKITPESPVPMFTIDSYRTENRKSLGQVEKKIVRREEIRPRSYTDAKSRVAGLKEKNSKLLDEVQKQQRIIQQASAALNCCYDVHHGKGSITELEAEKLLLIASEKRLALLAEIQKLKVPTTDDTSLNLVQPCRGTLTIDHLQLPLRTEYIFSMASKKDGVDVQSHYYFLLVRCGAHKIFATHLASTHDSLSADSLVFKDKFQFDDLESDFEICIEVYSVNHRCRADGVPHQEKSKKKISGLIHRNKVANIKKKFEDAIQGSAMSCFTLCETNETRTQESLTPRKLKARSIHGAMPASPGGPNAIRISSFSMIGTVTFRLADVKRNKFSLQKVPFLSPISGHLACRTGTNVQSAAEQRGFLTMFQDVGGLGAWHRRWCALSCGVLYSWTYPDDEKHKEPLTKLEIRECVSHDIHTVERVLCARPNTFELRTMRPRRHGDKENLISQDTGAVITTRHWLAADTKGERLAWIESLNQALCDVRAWDPTALRPMS